MLIKILIVKKKKNKNYNFLAINFPLSIVKKYTGIIEMELWGDKGYNYNGTINTKRGDLPHLLIRLSGDTQIFIKLNSNKSNDESETVISFIQIPKRYQISPNENNIESKRLQNNIEHFDNIDNSDIEI